MNPAAWPHRAFDSADVVGLMVESAKVRFSAAKPYRDALALQGFRIDEDGDLVDIIEEEESNKPAPVYHPSRYESFRAWLLFQFDRSSWAKSKRRVIATHYEVERFLKTRRSDRRDAEAFRCEEIGRGNA